MSLLECSPLPSEGGKILQRVYTRAVVRPLAGALGAVVGPVAPAPRVIGPLAPGAVVRPLRLLLGVRLVPARLPLLPGLLDPDSSVEVATDSPPQPITVGAMLAGRNPCGLFPCGS